MKLRLRSARFDNSVSFYITFSRNNWSNIYFYIRITDTYYIYIIYIYVYIYIYIYIFIYVYIYTYIHIHKYIKIHNIYITMLNAFNSSFLVLAQ